MTNLTICMHVVYAGWNENPSSDHYAYRSRNFGEDSIFVPKNETGGYQFLYLTVQSTDRSADFSIVYQVERSIQLSDGAPQTSFVHQGAMNFFSFQATQKVNLTISVSG